MSYFGRNIRKIRNAKKISQTAFADLFNLKRGSIGAYEEGRAEAKIDTIIEIANYFELTLDQLLAKELTINEIYHLNERSRKLQTTGKTTAIPKKHAPRRDDVQPELEKVLNGIEERLSKIEEKIDKIEERLGDMSSK